MTATLISPTAVSVRASRAPVLVRDLGLVEYDEAWELQRQLARARAEETVSEKNGGGQQCSASTAGGRDVLLLLEHPPVYTAGRRTEHSDLPFDGSRVVSVDRGGKITWHGPGQLVGYPIIKLDEPIDVINYVRRLEEALIRSCAEFGVNAGRVEGRSGVWLPADPDGQVERRRRLERKIGSIGVRVQRGVTLHGLSLNCDADLAAFANIVPCGIPDVGATSLSVEAGRRVTVAEALPVVTRHLLAALDGKPTASL